MADDDKLTDAQKEALNKWFETKPVGGLRCSVCQTGQWSVLDQLVTPVFLGKQNSINLGGRITPLVSLACSNCGHTIFVNAIVAGVVPKEEPPK